MKIITRMKSIPSLLILILLLGSGYFVWEKVLPNLLPTLLENVTGIDPFKLDDSYKIDIERSEQSISPTMTIKNNSEINLRLHMFNASDEAKIIARENWVLKKGESRSYPRDSYVFHVWKSQFLDASIKWTEPLWTDIEFLGDEKNLTIKGSDKPPVTIRNEANKPLKICIYKESDKIQAIPLDCWTLSPGTQATWEEAPQKFLLKVFEPALLDDPVLTQNSVQDMSTLTITGGPR